MSPGMLPGWGNVPCAPAKNLLTRDWRFERLPGIEEAAPLLAVGMRRSYGDVCVNEGGTVLSTRRLDRFFGFDAASGLLDCEPGLTLGEILRVVLPRGWYLPVVPGTQHVTLGGATANDVHGKNHFRAGSFGCHVREIELLRSDRGCTVCSLERDEELFRATIGGLGLTGLMLRVQLQLRRVPGALMRVEEQPFASLAEYVALLRERQDREYSVAWIDGSRLGAGCRGLASFADHAPGACGRRRTSIGVPVTLPLSLVGNTTAWCFSRAYAALRARRASAGDVDHAAYFFPLDGVGGWNRFQ